MPAIRFIHCADLHLGARFGRLPVEWANVRRQHQRDAFAAAVDLALDPDAPAEVFLIAGDSFDSDKPHPKDIAFFVGQLQRLRDNGVRTFIIPGNHDRYSPGSWWDRAGLPVDKLFKKADTNGVKIPELDLTVFALPYDAAKSSVNLVRGSRLNVETSRSILMVHGTWLNFGRDECEVECHPFSTDDLSQLSVDYVALGHFHATREASPPRGRPVAFYPGTPEATGFGPNCEEAGGIIVGEITEGGVVAARPRRVNTGRHRRLKIDCTHESPESLERAVSETLKPNDYAFVELSGTPTAETALAAEELAERIEGRCAYLSVQTDFADMGSPDETNVYLAKFREAIAERIAQVPQEDRHKWHRALELGTVAFLSAGGR